MSSSSRAMSRLSYLVLSAFIYAVVIHVPVLNLLTIPVILLSTFLHEFGHAFFAIVTGGSVRSLAVNIDGSGVTTTLGGNAAVITLGGYIGSALFGNLMLRLADAKNASLALKVLSVLMFLCALIWFNNLVTSLILLAFSIGLWFTATKRLSPYILSFLGVACVIYIIQDFNVGPSSDLRAYEKQVGLFSAKLWMYLWLLLVLAITGFNVYTLLKKKKG